MCLRKIGVKHIKGLLFMSDLYNRIEKLCADNGINITTMCKESGASRASLTDLKMGRKQGLSTDTLSKISNYFGVSVDYLLGNEPKAKTPAETGERTVSDEDIRFALFNGADDITDEMFEEVKRFAQFIQERERKKSD